MSETPVITDSARAIDAMARRKYEAFDSHFSMPGGLSWEAYKADDPAGAEMYVSDASDDLAALLASGAVQPLAAAVVALAGDEAVAVAHVLRRVATNGKRKPKTQAALLRLADALLEQEASR